MLNVALTTTGQTDSNDVNKSRWSIRIEFGEVVLELGEAGALSGTILGGDGVTYHGNLAEGRTKEGPPQQWHINEKEAYVIVVYPVWNGVIVSSGGQDARGVVHTSSTVIKKYRDVSVMVGFSDGFDPTDPDEVFVDTTYDGKNVIVDFGTSMILTGTNCRFDFAYLPCFFTKNCWFDQWWVANNGQLGVITYDYKIYPIWTDNNTDYELNGLTVHNSGTPGPLPDTSYKYVNYRLEHDNPEYLRYAGEIMGAILETKETRAFPIKNDNGNFILSWETAPAPDIQGNVGGSTDWRDYIQKVSVTIGIDGSNGSIEVDKYGVAGQGAKVIQSIGAITISARGGGYGTVDGSIFQGLAMGIADAMSSGSASWTIPLIGLEKKLEDIALINVPFMDGHTLQYVVDFLCRYAGLQYNMGAANPNLKLSVSSDINTPVFDWKSGTSVKSALDDVMENTLHSYVIRDGCVYFYELGENGLPLELGPDHSVNYPYTKIVTTDQTPDFENLRNEIVVMALQQVPEGQDTDVANIPLFPITELRKNTTNPDVPWAKSIFRPIPGAMTQSELSQIADRLAKKVRTYDVLGRVQIQGNANIKVYDRWGDFVIGSVTHNIDLENKTWTTDLELTRATTT
jgi:hypothetical protein